MPIRVTCTKCHTRFNVSEKFAGKQGPCPKCKTTIRIPDASEEVIIEAPKPKGPVDTKGQSILKPVRRKETRLTSVEIALIAASIVGFLILALVMRTQIEDPRKHPLWLLVVSAIGLAPPIIYASYTFLRDQDREAFWRRELWVRVSACSAVFALSWLALPVASFAFNDSYETGSYIVAVIAMFAIGTVGSMAAFEFDWLMAAVQYGMYLGIGLLGRALAGLGALPVNYQRLPESINGAEAEAAAAVAPRIFDLFETLPSAVATCVTMLA